MARDLDIVVFGATGFTGRLVVEYLARAAPGLRLGVAGRDRGRLDEVREHARARGALHVDALVADVGDEASLDAMAGRTRVILTTVGPYAKYGEPVVRAAIKGGADYLDLTGEPDFARLVLDRYGRAAEEAGVRVVCSCGFESVPHDMGVYFVMRELAPAGPAHVEGFIQSSGQFSGGTWHSAVHVFSEMRQREGRPPAPDASPGGRVARAARPRPRFEPEVSGWAVPFPSIDPQVVVRSARALDLYGPSFTYALFVRIRTLPRVVAAGAAVLAVVALAQLRTTRDLLLRWKPPGEGPSEAVRQRSYFRITIVAEADGKRIVARVSGGDPGYGETAKMISECALALVQDRARLPGPCGVLTPAVAFGPVLLERLIAAGIRFEVVRREGASA